MKGDQRDHYIFYLQYTVNLPRTFFILSEIFKKFNISLIPVTPNELASFASSKKQYVLSTTADITSQKGLANVRRSFLDFALLNQKFCLFDVSSFGKIEISYKLEKNHSYFHYSLPMSYNEIVANVATSYFAHSGAVKSWPGGKRAKLPPMA